MTVSEQKRPLKLWVAGTLSLIALSFILLLGKHGLSDEEIPETIPLAEETPSQPEVAPEPELIWREGSFSGKPFYNCMLDAGLRADQVHGLIDVLTPFYDFRRANPRHSWRLGSSSEKPRQFELHVSAAEIYDINGFENKLSVERRAVETVIQTTVVRAELTSSLYGALKDQPDNASLAMNLSNVFAYEIDFYQDPRAGDRFELLVEQNFIRNGDELIFNGWGRILAARYHGQRETAYGYIYKVGKEEGYYDLEGKSLVRDVLRSPLKLQRITSSFKPRRFHPILKRYKDHNGVDYGVPKGTPVMAVANGKVRSAGRLGGAGKAVILSHSKDMLTQYFHLNSFAKGVRAGASVKQGQVIGYVGKTGLATSYHLHFGMKIKGKYVNPLKQKFQPGLPIVPSLRDAFDGQVQAYNQQLDQTPVLELADSLVYDPGFLTPYLPKLARIGM